MPLFSYKVIDANGKEKKGNIEGESKNSIKNKFQSEGLFVSEIIEKHSRESFKFSNFASIIQFSSRKANVGEVASMTRLLATMLKANVPLVESINAVAEQQENPHLKETLMLVKQKLQEGYSFSKAAKDFPDVFSSLYCNMLAAGEESGALDKVFVRLSDFLESQVELRNKVKSAMTYPIVLMVFALIAVSALFIVVIPQLSSMFKQMQIDLPPQTRFIIWLSSLFSDYWYIMLTLIGAIIFFVFRYIKSEKGMLKWHRMLITMPIFGKVNRMVAISRFSKTLSTLLTAGVPILGALDIVKRVIDNKILENAIATTRENVKEGESIAVPLKRSGEFPPIVTNMIAIGEKSGELEEMLETIADSFEKEVNYTLSKLTSLLEPVMLVALGLMIGFIIYAVIMPIFQMNEQIG